MTIQDVVARFNTTPFLFAGSGITRRYYQLPDWIGLLTHFASLLKKDDALAFRSYESRVPVTTKQEDRLPMVASIIEREFNIAWFDHAAGIRSSSESVSKAVSAGTSPFKAEVAAYLQSMSNLNAAYTGEVEKLRHISRHHISGIITTNYDSFFESLFDGYKTFVGQDELVFSQLQGVAEIYKIHGSVDEPSSIIINQADYQHFHEKGKYLAAKLMTIFMEYPIIFIGYSISDANIQAILADVVECLPHDKIETLQKRFVFVEYRPDMNGSEVSPYSMMINGKVLEMTKIAMADFGLLYDALSSKKATIPVKILRRFKDELYTFALTNKPGPMLQVTHLDDRRIDENTLALTIGLAQTGRSGLVMAVKSEQWYRNIVLHDLPYNADDLLECVYPDLAIQNSRYLPVWYYLSQGTKTVEDIAGNIPHQYADIVTNKQTQKSKTAVRGRSAKQIWQEEKSNFSKAIRLLGNLPEGSVHADELQDILEEIFNDNPDILSKLPNNIDRTNLRRLIKILDYVKYAHKKTP